MFPLRHCAIAQQIDRQHKFGVKLGMDGVNDIRGHMHRRQIFPPVMFPDKAKRTERLAILAQRSGMLVVVKDLRFSIISNANVKDDLISRWCDPLFIPTAQQLYLRKQTCKHD